MWLSKQSYNSKIKGNLDSSIDRNFEIIESKKDFQNVLMVLDGFKSWIMKSYIIKKSHFIDKEQFYPEKKENQKKKSKVSTKKQKVVTTVMIVGYYLIQIVMFFDKSEEKILN